ncbi:hypothetical protein HMPREF9243_0098 [Aerococcus sp. Group 1]|nr:hypothetical protein HMPREF9243_0098 [Aerococcus sp. Group 1]
MKGVPIRREAFRNDLWAEISQSFADLDSGRTYSMSAVKNYFLSHSNWL